MGILSHLDLESTPINTKGYETLLQLNGLQRPLVDGGPADLDLMHAFNYGVQIENLDRAFETVKQKLFGRLHDILRKQIVERVPVQGAGQKQVRESSPTTPSFLPNSEKMKDLASFAVPPPHHDHKEEAVPIAAELALLVMEPADNSQRDGKKQIIKHKVRFSCHSLALIMQWKDE
ncbi:hypothetical protein ACLOJK_008827 [Asimina triloba]